MPRYSLKSVLLGVTAAAIGFAMLGIAFQSKERAGTPEVSLSHAFLLAIGGALAGFGLAFPVQWPPYRWMIAPMLGMFAAQAWDSGSWVGLAVYVGLLAVWGIGHEARRRIISRADHKDEV